MIISKKNNFIFLKTAKTAGTSIEFYLSQFCGNNDTITSLLPNEEKLKKKFNLKVKKNYEFKKIKFTKKNFLKLSFLKKVILNDHSSLSVLENKIKYPLNDYYIFAFVRNPYHWIVSYFWWYLFYEKILDIKKINRLTKKEINLLFKIFLKLQCAYYFNWMKDIIYSKKYMVHVYKYENLNKSMKKLKSILSLKNEKNKFGEVYLKSLKISLKTKQKLKLDKEDIKFIKNEAKYFFDKYNYSKKVPKMYTN
tara:strand:+ start:4599 stop:5351 length:753 start_codon:yes stop_codon:yes gene_type:complete